MADNNAVPTQQSLLEFQEIYLRAIALAWENEEFKRKLLADPHDALERYLDYRCPWILNLKIVEAPANEPAYGWNAEKQRWYLPVNSLSVGIPAQPANLAEEAIALAAYNDAGPAYLFTCC
ncbi:BMA_0021/BMA_0022 family TOMM bacteriocin [Burkholderia thailandensis]|uniref:Ribosomal natural product, two-chain TOMM family protein n=2 Tax=Burkholderia thailandensis TaxID=57975 RepID=A0AAW9CV58_BURTH|nr:BMA_0021/BMA_0022 family TOMM bacteriocin [Burkholderia thailandensis]ABC37086.1 conserved hypothetical protein [Burkholderia thailandensis E264]AHI64065.1 ribosomal natural product, two-chain TOMM family protein [Burkholderia thailandensis H0587]AHI73264.1 ribosomal natural product, two-chain TOMM family protein [Burkholderia thailandensis 2002721723]AHI77403.1 ribosomal natural product, two-chain TOMM family protein [Burkholderia thailandensis E444]AIC87204.1 ribosomal natural product, tw